LRRHSIDHKPFGSARSLAAAVCLTISIRRISDFSGRRRRRRRRRRRVQRRV
jgi:hypothetical protein